MHIVFMESAIKMGGRIPLRPQQNEGSGLQFISFVIELTKIMFTFYSSVIIYLGSTAPFSDRLTELQEEIRPLYKIASCTYKRTSVQTTFENAGFKMDWCAFRIVGDAPGSIQEGIVGGETKPHGSEKSVGLLQPDRWEQMARDEVPKRNYIDELAFSIAIPGMLLTILLAILSTVLCFYHDKM